MFKFIQTLFKKNPDSSYISSGQDEPAPDEIAIEGLVPFPIARHMIRHYGLPIPDWDQVQLWVADAQSPEQQAMAWNACEHAWLLHFCQALGSRYYLAESDTAVVLSSLEQNVANATLDYMGRALRHIVKVLDGIARVPEWGKDILIVFDNQDVYYNYVSYYYPEEGGDFALSGGMHIDSGCSHYVTVKEELQLIEPVIVHEMTHGCLAHLQLPVWLNEGIAVNTERLLSGRVSSLYSPKELRGKHLSFWGAAEIQEFWSGDSFLRPDQGNLLSYDLARILVEQMAKDWESFKHFTLEADWNDGGKESARRNLDVNLGEMVSSLLDKPDACNWSPQPDKW
jgi:hypothetical protein